MLSDKSLISSYLILLFKNLVEIFDKVLNNYRVFGVCKLRLNPLQFTFAYMITPIQVENDHFLIQSFHAGDLGQWSGIVEDVYALLSDNQALKYLPFKRLHSTGDADALLKNALISMHCGRNYLHFIRKKSDGRVIGFIDIISPGMAREHYRLQRYPYFIEFCIKTEYSRKKLMSSLLPAFLDSLRAQQVGEIAAVINRHNVGARTVLHRSGFSYYRLFDELQDIYRFQAAKSQVA